MVVAQYPTAPGARGSQRVSGPPREEEEVALGRRMRTARSEPADLRGVNFQDPLTASPPRLLNRLGVAATAGDDNGLSALAHCGAGDGCAQALTTATNEDDLAVEAKQPSVLQVGRLLRPEPSSTSRRSSGRPGVAVPGRRGRRRRPLDESENVLIDQLPKLRAPVSVHVLYLQRCEHE